MSQTSPIILENLPFLRTISRTKSNKKLKKILKQAGANQLLALVEICLNVVKSRFPLTTRQKKRLIPHADFVRRLSRCRSERGARCTIVQKGAGLPIATSLFTALLTPIILHFTKLLQQNNGQ